MELKTDFNTNQREILNYERELSRLEETDRREELEHYKTFSILNEERITPYFMSLVKNSKPEQSTVDIKNERGDNFENGERQTEYIGEYYRDIHRVPQNRPVCDRDTIVQFLGEACNNVEMRNSRLNNREREDLDLPFTVQELDSAIDQCNMKSAPGADGYSNKFIKHFWEYFRVPLHRYALTCFTKGNLTDNFRSANIKLIPPKKQAVNRLKTGAQSPY